MTKAKSLVTLAAVWILLGVSAFGFIKRQDVFDWWRLRGYTANPAISALADATAMTQTARRLFYVYHPMLQDKSNFRQFCTSQEESIVLGCYISSDGIYLLDVADGRLVGVEEVTAAHEMLHAAYERLSSDEQKEINALLIEAEKTLTDKRVAKTLAAYRDSSTNEIFNEMHSIFGTELSTLPPALEQYYERYFSDRSKVVSLAQAYATAFVSREERIALLDAELAVQKTDIEADKAELEQQSTELSDDREELDQLRQSDPEAYNTRVDSYNAAIRSYNDNLRSLKSQIAGYNIKIAERNSLALEEQQLVEAIDTRLQAL